jgi:hypothetical protein
MVFKFAVRPPYTSSKKQAMTATLVLPWQTPAAKHTYFASDEASSLLSAV